MHNVYIFEKIEINTVILIESHLFLHRKIKHNSFTWRKFTYEFFSYFYSFEITNTWNIA